MCAYIHNNENDKIKIRNKIVQFHMMLQHNLNHTVCISTFDHNLWII